MSTRVAVSETWNAGCGTSAMAATVAAVMLLPVDIVGSGTVTSGGLTVDVVMVAPDACAGDG